MQESPSLRQAIEQVCQEGWMAFIRSQAAAETRLASRQVSRIEMAVGPLFRVCQDNTLVVVMQISMQSRSARKQAVTSPSPSMARQASAQSSLTFTSASQAVTHWAIPASIESAGHSFTGMQTP
ncbi:hypothetical protein [Cryobacterium fucosi]|uniref:Uncharacterized protein n=1 Tax=Cryobacterium fucosi TaxID=1259157 RepID=A0A4R9B435_9MICO|nr:hypothetical protein [Cryobacterium fucosi]TFD74351.1 hypothetical protein E3T48_13530 [Cryobacterium fucosi]